MKSDTPKLSKRAYEILLKEQKGGCAICGLPDDGGKKLAVDHCHTTLCTRGLLCRRCNMMLGCAEDSVKILQQAIEYLRKTTPPATLAHNEIFCRAYQRNKQVLNERDMYESM